MSKSKTRTRASLPREYEQVVRWLCDLLLENEVRYRGYNGTPTLSVPHDLAEWWKQHREATLAKLTPEEREVLRWG